VSIFFYLPAVKSTKNRKSTYARHLVAEAIEAEDLVPVLLELRRVERGVSLPEAIAREFDDLDRPFDRDLLFRLFAAGRFFMVFDGLDEVATDQREEIISGLEQLSAGAERSAIVLTTRPEIALPSLGNVRSSSIQPLTPGQSESLVRRYDRALGGLDLGERLITEFAAVPDRFLQTPLLVALLYRTFGYTYSISTRVSIFYDELYNALYKGHDLTKSGFVRPKASNLDVAEFRRLVRGYAFLVIANQKTSLRGDVEAQELASAATALTAVHPTSPSAFVDDLLGAVPLLIREGLEIRFVHKSVAEFFAAEYLGLGNAEGDQMIADILNGPLAPRFAQVFDFVAEINPQLFLRAIVAPIAEAALAFQPEEPDALLRTLRYLSDLRIGVWPQGESRSKSPHENEENEERQEIFRIVDPQKQYNIHVAVNRLRVPMTFLAWTYVTDVIAENVPLGQVNISAFIHHLPLREWVALEDEHVLSANGVPEFRRVLIELLSILQQPERFWRGEDNEARVLSNTKLRKVCEAAHSDRAARESVRKLLARS
jgi:hypothetical protein